MSSAALERAEALLAVEPGSNVKSAAWWFAAARDMAREVAKLEAALAVAREREQRLREALESIVAMHPVDSGLRGADVARAALVDEPAAAKEYALDNQIVGKSTLTYGDLRRSASAAADEPGETP